MKKSDLTRRAERDAKRVYRGFGPYQPDHEEAHAFAFERGYRAARADLRRKLKGFDSFHEFSKRVSRWLRPIR